MPRANYHCLRHTFATRAVEVGMDTPTLKEIMGHARIETTMQYIHAGRAQDRLHAQAGRAAKGNLF